MIIKPNRYYKKKYYTDSDDYDIHYTDDKWCYIIATKYRSHLLIKHTKKVWGTIKKFQDFVNISDYSDYTKIEEMSKEDVFLEML